jgi:hypothetical protein
MVGRYTKLLLLLLLSATHSNAEDLWQRVVSDNGMKSTLVQRPINYLTYRMNGAALKLQMFNLSADPADGMFITLPLPDGSFRDFRVWQTSMLPQSLAAKYPEIRTYTAEAVDDPYVTAKLDFTAYGFHAMIFDGEHTSFVDPANSYDDGLYMVHYKSDEIRAATNRMRCLVHRDDEDGPGGVAMITKQKKLPELALKTINGYQKRTYRLALSANSYYCQAVPVATTKTQALSKMTTTMNRVNGVYEREFSVRMDFVTNEEDLIFLTPAGDPFFSINSNPSACLSQNQTQCDNIIGNSNYDVGHVFTTGAGGLSLVGCVCQSAIKAQSVTGSPTPVGDGFDIDYVAHEMGHEFGGDHTFNNDVDANCAGNAEAPYAYEPASGSTIMAYAGICGPDNVQPHSDPYFHAGSLLEMYQFIAVGAGNSCPVKTATGNKPVAYAPFAAIHSIPYLTPFELIGPPLTDSLPDDSVKLYCWEEWDLGDFGQRFTSVTTTGPNFRSFNPTKSPLRVFPKLSMVLTGSSSDAGVNNNSGEKLPTVPRSLNFRCTFRNIRHNLGCFTFPDDQVTLNAVATPTGQGFKVTSQNSGTIIYSGGSSQSVTWTVLNTNTAPISASNVDIYMSTNNGSGWQYYLGTFPNTGTATVTIPNPGASSSTVRFKVKGAGNVFFNVNSASFTVTYNPALPVTPTDSEHVTKIPIELKLFPVPTHDVLHIITDGTTQSAIYNIVGQMVWKGTIYNQLDLPVLQWPRGVYCMVLMGDNKQRIVRRIVLD